MVKISKHITGSLKCCENSDPNFGDRLRKNAVLVEKLLQKEFSPAQISAKSLAKLFNFKNSDIEVQKLLSSLTLHALSDHRFTERPCLIEKSSNKYSYRFNLPTKGDVELEVDTYVDDNSEHLILGVRLTSLLSGENNYVSFESVPEKNESFSIINKTSSSLRDMHAHSMLKHNLNFRDGFGLRAQIPQSEELGKMAVLRQRIDSPDRSYKTQAEFSRAIKSLVRKDAEDWQVNSGMCYGSADSTTLENAWHAYNSAKNISTALILGRHYRGVIIPSCDESFPCVDEKLIKNMGLTSDKSNLQNAGGVFLFSNWSLAVNDAFMLGAIHSGQDIFFASKLSKENIWSTEESRLTVTGRELVSLHSCNRYQMHAIDPHILGKVARFNHANKQPFYGFTEYLSSIRSYSSRTDLLDKIC